MMNKKGLYPGVMGLIIILIITWISMLSAALIDGAFGALSGWAVFVVLFLMSFKMGLIR